MKPKIIYIIGAGRSGTTLLDIIIGNNENISSCGEINRYPRRKGFPPKCEKGTQKYIFWEKIRQDLALPLDNYPYIEQLTSQFEYHSGFVKNLLGLTSKRDINEYQSFQSRLFDSLLKYSSNNIKTIVDSSKYPGRALMLSKVLSYEIAYIYIKRDPVSVVRSFSKKDIEQPSKSWLMANCYYFIVNLLCRVVLFKLRRDHKVVEITYESMVNEPKQMLRKLESHLNIDLSSILYKIDKNIPLSVGELFDGNRIRLKKEIIIRPSTSLKKKRLRDTLTRYLNLILYRPNSSF